MRAVLALFVMCACSSTLRTKTHAFVPDAPCGQGPYEVHVPADGKTGEEGLEVIACTAHHLTGTAEMRIGGALLQSYTFGDGEPADNARCLAGRPIVATAASGAGGSAGAGGSGGAASAAKPMLIERPFYGSETRFADELCKQYGLQAQTVMMATLTRTEPGVDLHLRLWSEVPNDLDGAVFLVQHLTSKKTKEQVDKEWAKLERKQAKDPPQEAPKDPRRIPEHGPPPAPLAEAKPAQPTTNATWIAGYWQWTGSQWGWVAGFWRDERVAMPVPRVEVPGQMPSAAAVWIGGAWQLRGGAWIWVEGRWRP